VNPVKLENRNGVAYDVGGFFLFSFSIHFPLIYLSYLGYWSLRSELNRAIGRCAVRTPVLAFVELSIGSAVRWLHQCSEPLSQSVFFRVHGRTRADGGRTAHPTGPSRALCSFPLTSLWLICPETSSS